MFMTKNFKVYRRTMGKKLCETCRTGQEMLSLDEHTFTCPYIRCNTGKKCYFYKPLYEKKSGIKYIAEKMFSFFSKQHNTDKTR